MDSIQPSTNNGEAGARPKGRGKTKRKNAKKKAAEATTAPGAAAPEAPIGIRINPGDRGIVHTEAVRDVIQILFAPGQVFELRVFGARFGQRNYERMGVGYFDDVDLLLDQLARIESATAVYVTLNPPRRELLARASNRLADAKNIPATSDKDIERRQWLLIDLDPVRPAGISSTDSEHDAAIHRGEQIADFLTADFNWPAPYVCSSGNGAHLLYRVDLPNDDDATDLIRSVLATISDRFTDENVAVDKGVFNAGRLVRLYGTVARKGDYTADRPHRLAYIYEGPELIVTVSQTDLEALAASATVKLTRGMRPTEETHAAFDLDAFIARNELDVIGPKPWQKGRRWVFRTSPMCEHHGDGPHLEQHASGAISAGCHHQSCTWDWSDLRALFEPMNRLAATTFRLTDLGNAERFVAQHGDVVRFVPTWGKWFLWDGTRWARDDTNAVPRHAKSTVRSIENEVAALANGKNVHRSYTDALQRWAHSSEKRERLSALLKLAEHEEKIAIHHEVLDREPWLLNCANGTIDLRTGELRPARPADLLTQSTGIYYPAASHKAPVWEQFLASTFAENQELIDFLQRLFGLTLIGEVREHILAIFWGSGANGKTTLIEAVSHALGSYAWQAPENFLLASRNEKHPTERAELFGRRMASITETADGQRLDEQAVKALTGGDRITARRMYEDFWSFVPSHTPFLSTNHKPIVRGTDHAIWRRLLLIPFNVRFVDPDKAKQHPNCPVKDPLMPDKLKKEAPAILQWMVQGCMMWQRDGLRPPDVVRIATHQYRTDSDLLGTWLREACEIGHEPRHTVRAAFAHEQYRLWASAAGLRPMSLPQFGNAIRDRGFTRKRFRDGYHYFGFRFRPAQGPK